MAVDPSDAFIPQETHYFPGVDEGMDMFQKKNTFYTGIQYSRMSNNNAIYIPDTVKPLKNCFF